MKHSNKLSTIETIRGLAALSVCLFHFSLCKINFTGSTAIFSKLASYGWVGVEAFFVVSGFIIPYALDRTGYTVNNFFRFFARRCIRIEPAYLVSILLVLVAGFIAQNTTGFNGHPMNSSITEVLLHIGYLPKHFGYNWLLPIYWSLEAEFHYYILIGLFFGFIWHSKFNLLIGLIIGLVASFFIKLHVIAYMPFFVMGIITCSWKLQKVSLQIYLAVLIACFVVFILRGLPLIMPTVGISTSLIIAFIDIKSTVTDFLGKISFSLYLIHIPVGGKLLNLFGRVTQNGFQVWIAIILALGLTIMASWIFYRIIELPSLNWAKKIHYGRV